MLRLLTAAVLAVLAVGAVQAAPLPTSTPNPEIQFCENGDGTTSSCSGRIPYAGPDSVSVGTTSTLVANAKNYNRVLQVCTLLSSTSNVYLNLRGLPAVVGQGVIVYAGGKCQTFGPGYLPLPLSAIYGITDSGSAQTVALAGG